MSQLIGSSSVPLAICPLSFPRRHVGRRGAIGALLGTLLLTQSCVERGNAVVADAIVMESTALQLKVTPLVTLNPPPEHLIVDPVSAEVVSPATIVIADRSERSITLYDTPSGRFLRQIGEGGVEDHQLTTLNAIALLGNLVGALDVHKQAVLVFDLSGIHKATIRLDALGSPARTIHTVNDSAFLVARFPRGREAGKLLSLIDLQGRIRNDLHGDRGFYRTRGPLMSSFAMPLADVRGGIIAGGFAMRARITAYDTVGNTVAAGTLPDFEGAPLVRLDNYDASPRPFTREDLEPLIAWLKAQGGARWTQVRMAGPQTLVLQLDYPLASGQQRRSFQDSAMFVPAGIDPERRRIVVGRPMVTVGRLVGQDPSGGVLLIRGDESSVSAELVSLKVEHDNGT